MNTNTLTALILDCAHHTPPRWVKLQAQKTNNTGFLLLELALALAIASLFLIPLSKLQFTLTQANQVQLARAERNTIETALNAFIVTHGRLPCPANTTDLVENRLTNQHCFTALGQLPSGTLGLNPQLSSKWQFVVATLDTAGAPAAHSLFKNDPFEELTLQTLTEIIQQPPSMNLGLDEAALPALHACLLNPVAELPLLSVRGCGEHTLHSPSIIAFALPVQHNHVANQNRVHQVFTGLPNPDQEPIWISYEQFVWLKTKANQIH